MFTEKPTGENNNNDALFLRLNQEFRLLNGAGAAMTWRSVAGVTEEVSVIQKYGEKLTDSQTAWHNKWCTTLMGNQIDFTTLTVSQKRQIYLFCRGPKYTPSQSRFVGIRLLSLLPSK